MNRRFILTLIFIIFLTACGQTSDLTEPLSIANNTNDERSASLMEKNVDTGSNETSSLSDLKVHYIDVGQADATLFQYSDQDKSYTILFDTGDWKGDEVVNYLKAQDVSTIDLVVVSHPDADHIGQLDDVVQDFDVGEVWMSGNESSSQTFMRGVEAVINSEADYHEPRAGEEYEIGPLEITVLYPETITGKSNEESISLLFTYGSTKFLFTGDAGKSDERNILSSGIDIGADILHLGHHGSNTSSDHAFIHAVDPVVAIYSAGVNNLYGHPSQDVVSHIKDAGVELYGTDKDGTIVVTSDGENFHIETNKEETTTDSNTSNSSEQDPGANAETAADNSCINLNTATISEVQAIIHIGPERAAELIDLRPFNALDDLSRIQGIGPARMADIKEQDLACMD